MLSSITKHGLEVLIGVTNLAEAAYGAVRAAGWRYVDLEDLGVPDRYIDETGHFFVNGEAAACVLTNDEGRVVVSFRGKDSPADWNDFPRSRTAPTSTISCRCCWRSPAPTRAKASSSPAIASAARRFTS